MCRSCPKVKFFVRSEHRSSSRSNDLFQYFNNTVYLNLHKKFKTCAGDRLDEFDLKELIPNSSDESKNSKHAQTYSRNTYTGS